MWNQKKLLRSKVPRILQQRYKMRPDGYKKYVVTVRKLAKPTLTFNAIYTYIHVEIPICDVMKIVAWNTLVHDALLNIVHTGNQDSHKASANVSCGVRTHAQLPAVDLKSTPLATRANWQCMEQIRITRSNMAGMDHRRKYQFREVTNTFAFAQPEHLEVVRITFFHRHCVRAVKEMDSKSIGLCPQGFESPRCRYLFPLHMRTM